jgi:hypothetical protein
MRLAVVVPWDKLDQLWATRMVEANLLRTLAVSQEGVVRRVLRQEGVVN